MQIMSHPFWSDPPINGGEQSSLRHEIRERIHEAVHPIIFEAAYDEEENLALDSRLAKLASFVTCSHFDLPESFEYVPGRELDDGLHLPALSSVWSAAERALVTDARAEKRCDQGRPRGSWWRSTRRSHLMQNCSAC